MQTTLTKTKYALQCIISQQKIAQSELLISPFYTPISLQNKVLCNSRLAVY